MNWVKTSKLIKLLFPNYIWSIPNANKTIYLTFDDGPIPEVTEWVLTLLKAENIKATFFCIGDNISKHPLIFKRIIEEGHQIGNHTFNHLNGWKTKTENYISNFEKCEDSIETNIEKSSKIFRPPYGKIKPSQSLILRKLGYKIIMWDVLSYDFDQQISKEKCLENVIQNTQSGSIIVFHDSLKAYHNLSYALPEAIKALKKKGFTFDVLN